MTAGILNFILWFPIIMAVVTYLVGKMVNEGWAKWFAVGTVSITTILTFFLWIQDFVGTSTSYASGFLYETRGDWFKSGAVTITYHIGVDGLSMPLLLLTQVVFLVSAISSFYIHEREPLYYGLYLFLLTGLEGTFVALDLFLFYIFWEIVLVPMFFIIAIWGGANKYYASMKFFIYTHLASLIMLIGLIMMFQNGNRTFNMVDLRANLATNVYNGSVSMETINLIFWLVFIGFIVKFPQVPFHTWLPDAHVQAPSPGSSILAGLLLKMGGYGLIRVGFWLIADTGYFTNDFGKSARVFMGAMAAISMIYPAFIALRQIDLKKMIAYSSISHMGIVLLGLAAFNTEGFNAAIFMMVAHGIISPGLFLLAGIIEHNTKSHTRDMDKVSGLTFKMPFAAALFVFLGFGSAGLPGLAGFVAEFLGFTSAFNSDVFQGANLWIPVTAVLSVIVTAGYYLWAMRRVLFNTPSEEIENATFAKWWETGPVFVLAIVTLVLGVVPAVIQKVMDEWAKSTFFP